MQNQIRSESLGRCKTGERKTELSSLCRTTSKKQFTTILISLIMTLILKLFPQMFDTRVEIIRSNKKKKKDFFQKPSECLLWCQLHQKCCIKTLAYFVKPTSSLSLAYEMRKRREEWERPDCGGKDEVPSRITPDPDDLIETGWQNSIWVQKAISSEEETWEAVHWQPRSETGCGSSCLCMKKHVGVSGVNNRISE